MTNKQASAVYQQLRELGLPLWKIGELCGVTPQAIFFAEKRGWSLQLREKLTAAIRQLVIELVEIEHAAARPNIQTQNG